MKYILLDRVMNDLINQGFSLYNSGRYRQALQYFEDILVRKSDNTSPVFGSIYFYLMTISYQLGDSAGLKRFYNELKSSSIINKDDIIAMARSEGLVR
jgi:tetratricopeptide (TPR) repeat protein